MFIKEAAPERFMSQQYDICDLEVLSAIDTYWWKLHSIVRSEWCKYRWRGWNKLIKISRKFGYNGTGVFGEAV